MTRAIECDVCGRLVALAHSPGCITLDVGIVKTVAGDETQSQTWLDIDLCHSCSDRVLETIRPALNDFEGVD